MLLITHSVLKGSTEMYSRCCTSRVTCPSRTRPFASHTSSGARQKVVILGSGWGGYNILRSIDKKRYDVTLISPNTYFAFTPLLASTAVGTLEFRAALEPVRRYTPQAAFHQAWCDSIDFDNKLLTCAPATPALPDELLLASPKACDTTAAKSGNFPDAGVHFTIPYDKLIIGVGAYAQTFGIPGVKEHALFLKDARDAREIRTRILQRFEQAAQPTLSDAERRRLLHFVIVGGGPTGVEFAAELHDLVASDINRRYPHLSKLSRTTLYDVAPKILQNFDEKLSAYAEKKFSRQGVKICGNSHVTSIGSGYLEIKEQGRVACGLVVWSTGLAPNPLVQGMTIVTKDSKTNGIQVDENLNVIMKDGSSDTSVWGIGDASAIKDQPLPATAQVATQQAKYLIRKLNAVAKGKTRDEPFEWKNEGSLAYIGGWEALMDRSKATGNPQNILGGRIAWLLWRSAYFTMTLSWRNKAVVPFYWFLNWIFGRDLSSF